MKKEIISMSIGIGIGLAIVSMILLSGCVEQTGKEDMTNKVKNLNINISVWNISLEKPKYTKNELIKIYVDVNASADIKNASLHVYGIASKQGQNLIDQNLKINLTKGANKFNFTVTAPTCTTGCGAKYYPGGYPLYANVSYENKEQNISISDMKTINVNLY